MKSYYPVVRALISAHCPRTILDAPSGSGWLAASVDNSIDVDGIDLYGGKPVGYRSFTSSDLDLGFSADLPSYDMIVSCEGIEHFSNPGIFFSSAREHLNPNGILVVTTPNTWHPTARIKYLTRGAFPGFPVLAGQIKRGTHMHIMPWSWPQLYLHLSLAGFIDITLHPCIGKARQWLEKTLGFGMKTYCWKRERKSSSEEERKFWNVSSMSGALFSGQLVVSGRKPQS